MSYMHAPCLPIYSIVVVVVVNEGGMWGMMVIMNVECRKGCGGFVNFENKRKVGRRQKWSFKEL